MRHRNSYKGNLDNYESEGSAIRKIMHEKLVTHYDRGVDTPHYRATMLKRDLNDLSADEFKKKYGKSKEEKKQEESLWDNIHKKRARIKAGSGEKMRKKGDKGAPTPAQMKRAQAIKGEK